jgi:hypothetical protein
VTEREVLDEIRAAAEHRGGMRCRALLRVTPDRFAAIAADVARLCRGEPPSEVTRPGHVTRWTRPFGEVLQWSLLSRSGRFDDFSTDHDRSCEGKRFARAADYPALGELVASWPHLVNVRINALGPRAGLSPHEEQVLFRTGAGTIGARVRCHLPIATGAGAELMLDGGVYHLEAGTVYFVNHGCVHAAANRGDASRIHLVWDVLLTRAVFDFMFGGADVPGMERVDGAAAEPPPIRTEPVGAYERLAPDVTRDEAARLALCEPQ